MDHARNFGFGGIGIPEKCSTSYTASPVLLRIYSEKYTDMDAYV